MTGREAHWLVLLIVSDDDSTPFANAISVAHITDSTE